MGADGSDPLSLPALPSGSQPYASERAQSQSQAAPSGARDGTPVRRRDSFGASFGGTAGLAATPRSQRRRSDLGSGGTRRVSRRVSMGVRCPILGASRFSQTAGRCSSDSADAGLAVRTCARTQTPFPDLSDISENEDETAEDAYVWGTNVSIARVCKRARRFLTTYTAPGADEAKYLAIIRQARMTRRVTRPAQALLLGQPRRAAILDWSRVP